jgi:hypothetical protein
MRVSTTQGAGRIASVCRPELARTHKTPRNQTALLGRRSRGSARDLPCPLAPVARKFEFELGLEGFLWLHPVSRCGTWRSIFPRGGDCSGPLKPPFALAQANKTGASPVRIECCSGGIRNHKILPERAKIHKAILCLDCHRRVFVFKELCGKASAGISRKMDASSGLGRRKLYYSLRMYSFWNHGTALAPSCRSRPRRSPSTHPSMTCPSLMRKNAAPA